MAKEGLKNHSNTKAISVTDIDNDGDLDMFVAGRVLHGKYPMADTSYLLENQNGKFIDSTKKLKGIEKINLINDAVFSDFDNDGDKDLIIVGEWMPMTILENNQGVFSRKENDNSAKENGWYETIKELDIDNDGDQDYLIGNWGNNNKFHPSEKKPLHIYADYLDANSSFDVVLSKVSKTGALLPVRGKQCSTEQTPYLKNKIKSYKEFAASSLSDIYGDENLKNATHYTVSNFTSIIKENMGNGKFTTRALPQQAQFSPTLAFEAYDFNNDGVQDIFGVGNVYSAEVETIRYDASKGYILLSNKDKTYDFLNDTSYFNNQEAKSIKKIMIKGQLHFLILNKNAVLKLLRFKS